ncbi:Methylamine utilisation protein MauE [Sinomicrobium oceani]|uniref:Methylamine utilisation protein MauE n=1 Tax=Sinomicrobium oceani TaxID=1150368 RepID=A0A1K1RWL8_9FLAO|nr:MauE/DoxX family redox-associated membrane protein [Sinomicrobium oceani]SFW76175.1 Methylamine utilisation protein MauE [Sinomicrobium oceani]
MRFILRYRPWIVETICLLFVVLFTYAAVSKLLEFEKFRAQLGQSPLLTAFADMVVWTIPAVELAISLLLFVPRFRLGALYASLSLMTLFTAYIVAVLYFSPYVPCSCGGILENLGWTEHLVFNLVFIALAIAGIVLYTTPEKTNTTRV